MTTLARLSFRVKPGQFDSFDEAFSRRLLPLLIERGLDAPLAEYHPPLADFYSHVFELENASQVVEKARALERDVVWRQGLAALELFLNPIDPHEGNYFHFHLYQSPSGPGRSVITGPGFRQGLWQSYGILDGMPACINDILQDKNGDLWFGTGGLGAGDGGLWRYDGARLSSYCAADGLAHERVHCLLEDRAGKLWIGTRGGGVIRWDGQSFQTYSVEDGLAHNWVECLLEDKEGNVWVASIGGLSCWDGHRFKIYTVENGLAAPSVTTILEDRQGGLWIGYGPPQRGLSRWDGAHFEHYTWPEVLTNYWVYCLFEDSIGQLWVGTSGGGLACWDGGSYKIYTVADGLVHNHVCSLLEDQVGELWCGTWGGGISCWDGKEFSTFNTASGLASDQVLSLLKDRNGYLWAGTLGGGLSRYDKNKVEVLSTADGLPNNGIMSLLEDCSNQLWVGTWSGASRSEGTDFKPVEALAEKSINALAEDRAGNVWFGTSTNGLIKYNGRGFVTFTDADGLGNNQTICLVVDRSNRLWAGSWNGVSCYDGKAWIVFTAKEGLSDNMVEAIIEDRQGHIWFGTAKGVSRYDGKSFTTYGVEEGLPHPYVKAMFEDREGSLWFGTDGGGICRYNGKGFDTFNSEDGLCHNQVHAIAQDRDGYFWFGTFGGGISRYDGNVFQTLSRKDGLAHEAVHQILQMHSGEILIATEGGLTHYKPQVSVPGIEIEEVIADRRYGAVDTVHLSASQQVIIFGFRGMSLTTQSDDMVYMYCLEGYDSDWQVSYAPRVEYPQLPLGDYTFRVRAIDRDLNYSKPVSLAVHIGPDPRLEGLAAALSTNNNLGEFVGHSAGLQKLVQTLEQVAPTDLATLILGETGTGKGLAARTLHGLSERSSGPFIQVHCGAIPAALVESEMFGHEQGAFTGAVRRKLGKVELASDGTLFLDEIGDMPLEAQVKLLRVLEEQVFERVGGTQSLAANVRVVAATNRDLEKLVSSGQFREDLYFRLAHFIIRLPPLRERVEDIGLLAHYFLQKMATHLGKELSQLAPEALECLQGYDWPGNVRELEHVVRRAVVVCSETEIKLADIVLGFEQNETNWLRERLSLEEVERRYIHQVLTQTDWVIKGPKGAAEVLGLPASTLRHRMKKLGIKRSLAR